ncbi:MAG: S9 family peptidase, partial [Ignavibacteria bacterium]|nr:S9 family peptidase [Ignavibacteria bacterium]
MLLEKADSYYSLSPSAKYLIFYQLKDSTWNSLDISTGKQQQLTNNVMDVFFDELNDIPNEAGPHGFAGWLNENNAVVYSRNNLWALDLTGKDNPQLLTQNSKSKYLTYRYLDMDKDEVLMSQKMYLSVFDEKTKTSGFAQLDVKSKELKQIIHDEARFSGLIKAKNADRFLFRKETFEVYPDLYFVENEFDKAIKVSNANPQQDKYCWGSVKLVSWRSFAGDSLEGLLYFPANFNADSTYPMVVYFYERHSDGLYRHYVPKPSRSVINISDYTSRGYFVFAPDIIYETARPGQSAYNAIISGTQSMIERFPQIDSKNMGLQGLSCLGYQTEWLVTRTN